MKHSKKFITGILFTGLTLGMVPNSNAGWFAFRESSVLTHEQQDTLQNTFMTKLISACWVFAQEVQGPIFKDILKERKKAIKQSGPEAYTVLKTVAGQLLYPYLICESRRQADHNIALMAIDPVRASFKDLNATCLEALRSENDGLVNEVIRQTVQELSTWTREQREEAFNILWDSVVAQNNLTLEVVPTLDQTSKMWAHVLAFVQVSGKNLCEKFANYLANILVTQLEEGEETCCVTCFRSCLSITKEILAQVPDILRLVLQIIQITSKNQPAV